MQACNYFLGGRKGPEIAGILPAVNWKPIREQLARARNRVVPKMTQQALADRVGVDKMTVHRLENIKKYPNHSPELDTLERIAEALKMKVLLHLSSDDDSDLRESRQSDTKGGPNQPQEGRPHDRPVPAPPQRKQILINLSAALLDAIAFFPDDDPWEQITAARPRTARKIKGNRNNRG